MAEMIFPNSFVRQFSGPLDVDLVFSTTTTRTNYLTSARKYPGQIVSDLQDGKAYKLSVDGTTWQEFGSINLYGGTDIKNLSANWENTYTTVSSASANWYRKKWSHFVFNIGDLPYHEQQSLASLSAFVLNSTGADAAVRVLTSVWDSTYTTVWSKSADWDAAFSVAGIDASVRSLSSGWVGGNSAYTTVNTNSAVWGSTYTNVNANSASYATISFTNNKFLPLSGGLINGRLDVSGSIYGSDYLLGTNLIATNASYPQFILRNDAQNNNRWSIYVGESTPTTGKPLHFSPANTSGTTSPLLTLTRTTSSDLFPGNVGIGTTTPDQKLTVSGNARISEFVAASAFTNSEFNDYLKIDPNDDSFRFVSNNIERVCILSDGNVGIGTQNPNQNLTVNGNISADGVIYGSSLVIEDLTKTNDDRFTVTWDSNLSGTQVSVGGLSGAYIDLSTPYTEDFDIRLASMGGSTYIQTSPNNDLNFKVGSSTTDVIFTTGGNVGIGTAVPSTKLHLSGGSFRIQGNAQTFEMVGTDHVYAAYYPDGISAGRKAWHGFGGSVANRFDITNEFTDGSGHICLFPGTNANVGINTATPNERLTVSGNISSDGNIYADTAILKNATIQTFTNPATATGNFLILNINGSNKAIRLWDFTS